MISLGGSRIAPRANEVDEYFIDRFERLVRKHSDKKFVVVTGGGSTARKYIRALQKLGESRRKQSEAGISITRFHASYLARIFGKRANEGEEIPKNMKKVANLLRKNQVVFCGALRWEDKKTSDGTAADLANYLDCPFINITDVDGLYTSNPKKNKGAKHISSVSWKKFNDIAKKIKFKAGQHFVLDQDAAKTIFKKKIPTYIVGRLSEMDKIISGRRFRGTLIRG